MRTVICHRCQCTIENANRLVRYCGGCRREVDRARSLIYAQDRKLKGPSAKKREEPKPKNKYARMERNHWSDLACGSQYF